MNSPSLVVGYLALFGGLGFLFVFVNLLVGHFVRPSTPSPEKLEIYECGEPTIGSSFVQFDLRFYVVALLFIIFDVEVAFFFPWATVYGKALQLLDPRVAAQHSAVTTGEALAALPPSETETALFEELGVPKADMPATHGARAAHGRPAGQSFDSGYRRVLCRAASRIRVRLASGRPGLGTGGGPRTEHAQRARASGRNSRPARAVDLVASGRLVPATGVAAVPAGSITAHVPSAAVGGRNCDDPRSKKNCRP